MYRLRVLLWILPFGAFLATADEPKSKSEVHQSHKSTLKELDATSQALVDLLLKANDSELEAARETLLKYKTIEEIQKYAGELAQASKTLNRAREQDKFWTPYFQPQSEKSPTMEAAVELLLDAPKWAMGLSHFQTPDFNQKLAEQAAKTFKSTLDDAAESLGGSNTQWGCFDLEKKLGDKVGDQLSRLQWITDYGVNGAILTNIPFEEQLKSNPKLALANQRAVKKAIFEKIATIDDKCTPISRGQYEGGVQVPYNGYNRFDPNYLYTQQPGYLIPSPYHQGMMPPGYVPMQPYPPLEPDGRSGTSGRTFRRDPKTGFAIPE